MPLSSKLPSSYLAEMCLVGYGLSDEDRSANQEPATVYSLRPDVGCTVHSTLIPVRPPAVVRCEPIFAGGCRIRTVSLPTSLPGVKSYRFPQAESRASASLNVQADKAHDSINTNARSAPREKENPARPKLPRNLVAFHERLFYLLQPPLQTFFRHQRLPLPARPFAYQWQGIAFLLPRKSALLADEMGLGKTMQAILTLRLLYHLGEIQHALVICPKPLVSNWLREFHFWAPDVSVEAIAGESSMRSLLWTGPAVVKIANYELLQRDVERLPQQQWDLVILDEAQRIKNAESKTAAVISQLRGQRNWALTGTPVENSLADIYSIFQFLQPKLLPPDLPVPQIKELLRDYILRRTKDQAAPDLPPKIIRDVAIELTPGQRESYHRAEREGVIFLRHLGRQVTVQHVFELIIRLKQICNFDPITGESAKLEQLRSDLEEVIANGRKALIFSQWVEPLNRMAQELQHWSPLLFHGGLAPATRQANLARFQHDPTSRLLLLTYSSGGVGLNLQCANYVFLFDRWWNPAVEEQAINRVHRIGQKEPVFITRYLVPDTIEQRVQQILEQKRLLFQELIGDQLGPGSLGLSQADLFRLFDLPLPDQDASPATLRQAA
mgnify:CR=1 FL=1